MMKPFDGRIILKNHVTLNYRSIVYGKGGIEIGDNTRIAANCAIVSSNKIYQDKSILIRNQGETTKGIKIGADVWIGVNSNILDGSNIADGCVIGAGSLVKGPLEPYGVYVGSPVRKISERI